MELSLCMIVKNEEKTLGACLSSVKTACDEIIVVDTGSTDGTKAVAAGFGARVEDYVWQEDFAAARNYAMSLATKPYILWLDADDVLLPDALEKLLELKTLLDGQVDAVMLPYHYAQDENGRPTLVFERERIVRRAAGFVFSGVVHEAMSVGGQVWHENIPVTHTRKHTASGRNLAIYEHWLSRGRRMTPRDQAYYAREIMAGGDYARAEQAFSAFLTMEDGAAINRADAYLQRAECLKRLGRLGEAKESLLLSLGEGLPDAKALCALGLLAMEANEDRAAAFWYRCAMQAEDNAASGAFVNPDARGYIPAMQLCVLYWRMGRHEEAERMNALALEMKPGDKAALSNVDFFRKNR